MDNEFSDLRDQFIQSRIEQAERNGQTKAWWEAQWGWNTRLSKDVEEVDGRLSAVEKKVVKLSTMAAAVGAIAGTALPGLLKALLGG